MVMDNNKSIGIFDSGLGGLTTLKELARILPNENIVYFGDTGRVPYGSKSKETIVKYALQDISFLTSLGVKFIISACGTVSSVAKDLNSCLSVPFVGVVKPTSIAACKKTKSGKIGVIGTTATIKSNSYKNEINSINKGFEVFDKDCPLFVPLVENGVIDRNDQVLKLIVEKYLCEFKNTDIDTLILGCTHYPIIKEAISDYLGGGINIIDAGKETALYVSKLLRESKLNKSGGEKGNINFYVSDSVDSFLKTARVFLGEDINDSVKRVYIENYGL